MCIRDRRTVTGAGASVLAGEGIGPRIKSCTIGKVIDYGVKDANNMGAAMAPAAADTIYNYLTDFDVAPDSFDAIVTGDLGIYGSNLMTEMLADKGYDLRGVARDLSLIHI